MSKKLRCLSLNIDKWSFPGYIGWVKVIRVFMFGLVGMSLSWARGPSIEDVPEYIDTSGRPVLFFHFKGKIVARECDPKTVASTEDSCKKLAGSSDL